MSTKLLAFDLETGGLDPDGVSLLEAYFCIINEERQIEDELHLCVKPNDGVYKVTAEALKINGIDLVKHNQTAIGSDDACKKLYDFLLKNSQGGKRRLTPLAHNIAFDQGFIHSHWISRQTWDQFCSYRVRDTAQIAGYLQDTRHLPKSVSTSLGALCKYFDISTDGAHTAKADTLMCAQAYFRMIDTAKKV